MLRLLFCLPLLAVLGCTFGPEPPALSSPPSDETTAPAKPAATKDDNKPSLDSAGMERLAGIDPVAFIEESLRRYDRDVRGYHVTLIKRERIAGKLYPTERVEVLFREKPFSVLMEWKEGVRLARKTLYVEGENDDQLLVVPAGWRALAGIVRRDPNGADARSSSRYPATEFGIKIGTQRARDAWMAAQKRGDLEVNFGGTKKVKELGDRPCWELKRIGYVKPEDDGITASTFYFDTENGLQVGSILEGENGELIGSYWFRDLQLNPTFSGDTFTREALRKR